MGDPNDYIPESLSNGDSHDVQFIWNRQEPETVQACIHDLITAQALSRPSAEAVCAWDDTYTYEELVRLAEAAPPPEGAEVFQWTAAVPEEGVLRPTGSQI